MACRRGGGDFFHMADAGGGFDDDLEADLLLAALRGLDRRHQRVDGVEVRGAADLGDHDHVQTLGRLFKQVHHVAVPPRCIK